jgi:Kdo2-lipid IVA lauroyltransferase/acyltransferase
MARLRERLITVLCAIVGRLPLKLRRYIGSSAGFIVSLFPSRDRIIAQLQIEKIAHLDKKLSANVYRHLGQVFMEALNFDEILSSPRLLNQSPIEEYWKNRKSTKGLIALSAHMGNWELVAASAAAQSVPLSVIGREARKNSWPAVFERIRRRHGYLAF